MIDPERYVAALRFAAERHQGQRVPDSELPYVVHVVSVAAETIAALAPAVDRTALPFGSAAGRVQAPAVDRTALPFGSAAGRVQAPAVDRDLAVSCALLHDTIEDTATTYAELADRFGAAVAEGVSALSKNESLPKSERMADSLRRIRAQPGAVWMVKLADRITNLAPPPRYWTAEKRRGYRDEAIAIADALAGVSAVLDARIRARIAAYEAYIQ